MNSFLPLNATLRTALTLSFALTGAACAATPEERSSTTEDELRTRSCATRDGGSPSGEAQGEGVPTPEPAEPAAASDDPFDPASCAGTLLAEPSGKFAPGASRASFGRYTLRYRERPCTSLTGCGPWSTPVDVKDVLQTGLYALITLGVGTANGYVQGQGRAELAVFNGQIVLELTDDGVKNAKSGVRHYLKDGSIVRSYEYGTSRYAGDELLSRSVLATAGGRREEAWLPEHQRFLLRGDIRKSCARLVASPGPAVRDPAYLEVEVGALLRY